MRDPKNDLQRCLLCGRRGKVSSGGKLAAALAAVCLAVALFAGQAAAQKLGSVPKVAPTAAAAAGEVLEWTSDAGRPYWYRLPKKRNGKPALVIMLHGTGGNHGWSFWNYPIGNGTFRGEDIVVSPDGCTPGQGNTFNFVQNVKDRDQLVQIIKTFRQAFEIGKVYLYGHSQGAFFSYWFAGEHPAIVDGIVAHAGNVLNVQHSQLAREKVGIAILHGEADAVVPVDCAHRTYKIYRDQGYQKLKLEIVDGLTARSGHWPLPQQVGKLLQWLDSVTADTAPAAIGAALSELAKDQPDLSTVANCAARAGKLIKKYKAEDRPQLDERLAGIESLLEDTTTRHTEALLQAGADSKIATTAPWIEHFRIAHAALAERRSWSDTHRSLCARAKKDEKRTQKALQAIAKKWNKGTFKSARATLEKALLAASSRDLTRALEQQFGARTKGITAAETAEVVTWIAAANAASKEGEAAAAKVHAEAAAAFRKAHPDWFTQ
ncbi:MAG: alpha/beta hydrolase [Planctomycetota bacterium]